MAAFSRVSKGPPKSPDLLPGDDRACSFRQSLQIGRGRRPSAGIAVPVQQQGGKLPAPGVVHHGRMLHPLVSAMKRRVERLECIRTLIRQSRHVIPKQRGYVGQRGDGEAVRVQVRGAPVSVFLRARKRQCLMQWMHPKASTMRSYSDESINMLQQFLNWMPVLRGKRVERKSGPSR